MARGPRVLPVLQAELLGLFRDGDHFLQGMDIHLHQVFRGHAEIILQQQEGILLPQVPAVPENTV